MTAGRALSGQTTGHAPLVLISIPPYEHPGAQMSTTAAQHLAHIRTNWPLLDDMRTTRHHAPWPPAGRLTDYLNSLDQADADEVASARAARDGSGAGEHPAPLRLDIVDTARAIEAGLLALADQAAQLQPDDLPGPERWHYNASWRYGAPWACVWLTGALDWLPAAWCHRIHTNAADAALRLDRAMDQVRRSEHLDHPCPHCRGTLHLHGGDGQPPTVRCAACGRTWRETDTAA